MESGRTKIDTNMSATASDIINELVTVCRLFVVKTEITTNRFPANVVKSMRDKIALTAIMKNKVGSRSS